MRDFRERFSSGVACLEYLVECRWPDGFVCPKCGGREAWLKRRGYVHECRQCGRHTSPTAGTVMHRSHIPIKEWFWAAYLMATHTPGISALQIQRQLGICGYQHAWHLLHRLRRGMVNDSRSPLSGLIEADESILGGPAKMRRGRGVTAAEHKTLIGGAVEVMKYEDVTGKRKEKAGRLRLSILFDASERSIGKFLEDNVARGSRIRTDGWRGYSETAMNSFRHTVRIADCPERASRLAPHIHRVFSNLKTWLAGTYHGVDPKHLQRYLDEFTFRFNRRATPMAAFQTLLGISARKTPLTFETLIST